MDCKGEGKVVEPRDRQRVSERIRSVTTRLHRNVLFTPSLVTRVIANRCVYSAPRQ